jgi:anti-anti-sigma regulatory factor
MRTRSRLDIVVGHALGTVLMTVRGPLRKEGTDRLHACVAAAIEQTPERVVIDLTGVTDVEPDAVAVLQQARSAAEAQQVALVLTSRRKETLAALEALPEDFTVV